MSALAPTAPSPDRAPVDADIVRLLEIGRSHNPLQLLAMVAFHHLVHPESEENDAKHGNGDAQVEYLLSLLLSQPFPAAPASRTPKITQKCLDLLNHLYAQASIYYSLTTRARGNTEEEKELISSLRLDTMHVRGLGYRQHMELHSAAIATPHDVALNANCGFTYTQLTSAISHIEQSVQANLDRANDVRRAKQNEVLSIAAQELGVALDDPAVRKRTSSVCFTLRHRSKVKGVMAAFEAMGAPEIFLVAPRDAVDATIFKRIALSFGDNDTFTKGVARWSGWPFNPSRIYERPLVEHDGKFYAFHVPLLSRNALTIAEEILKAGNFNYWQTKFLKRRDDWVESTAVDLIAGMLPGCAAHKNLYYDCVVDGKPLHTEVDGIIIYDDVLLVVEVKATTFSDSARRGAPDAIATSLGDSLDKAYSQAQRVMTLMRSKQEVPFSDENGSQKLKLRLTDYRQHFLISVTRESLGSFATRLSLTRRLGYIQGDVWPWAISLLDLQAISELVNRPSIFLHYLVRRLAANEKPELATSDEIDLFGYFLAGQLFFDEADERQADRIALIGFSEEIDTYFEAGQRGQPQPPRPELPLPAEFAALLTMLEQSRPRHFSTACQDLLVYNGELHRQVADNVPGIEEAFARGRCRQAVLGKHEDDTLPMIVLACCTIGSQQENQVLTRVREVKRERFPRHRVTVVLWRPPMATNQCRVHLL